MGSSDTTNKCFAFMQCNESCVKRIPTMPEMCRGMPEKGPLHVRRMTAAAGEGPCPPKRSPPLKCSLYVPSAMMGRIKAFSRGGRPSHAAARMRLTHAASNSREYIPLSSASPQSTMQASLSLSSRAGLVGRHSSVRRAARVSGWVPCDVSSVPGSNARRAKLFGPPVSTIALPAPASALWP
jgi:hypothetical protein